jgi:putative methyltransferase
MSREYNSAGAAVDAVFKGLTFKAFCSQRIIGTQDYLLASETLKYRSTIETILERSAVTAKALDINSKGLLYVLVYELLFGKGKIRGGGQVKRKLGEVQSTFHLVLADMMSTANATKHSDLLPEHVRVADNLRQYLRVNLLKVEEGGIKYQKIIESVRGKCPDFAEDGHIPNLLVLPVKAPSFGEHELVKTGAIIIQDKASCFPAQLLIDEWTRRGGKGDIIDACAAPGNKSLHLAALMKSGSGKVFAFDKNARRANLLQERSNLCGGQDRVVVSNADFLSLNVSDYVGVTAILLDPSCSGSGVAKSIERTSLDKGNKEHDAARLQSLRTFQLQILLKSITFPSVNCISYSTCSIHMEENESVVHDFLASPEAKSQGWDVKAPSRLTTWERRGVAFPGLADSQRACLIRTAPEDGMIGFFVTLFCKT